MLNGWMDGCSLWFVGENPYVWLVRSHSNCCCKTESMNGKTVRRRGRPLVHRQERSAGWKLDPLLCLGLSTLWRRLLNQSYPLLPLFVFKSCMDWKVLITCDNWFERKSSLGCPGYVTAECWPTVYTWSISAAQKVAIFCSVWLLTTP